MLARAHTVYCTAYRTTHTHTHPLHVHTHRVISIRCAGKQLKSFLFFLFNGVTAYFVRYKCSSFFLFFHFIIIIYFAHSFIEIHPLNCARIPYAPAKASHISRVQPQIFNLILSDLCLLAECSSAQKTGLLVRTLAVPIADESLNAWTPNSIFSLCSHWI